MECKIDRRIGAASAVMQAWYQTIVMKKEQGKAFNLPVDLTLTCTHEVWVLPERTTLQKQVSRRLWNLWGSLRNSDIQRELRSGSSWMSPV